jgi:hypothetical protein
MNTSFGILSLLLNIVEFRKDITNDQKRVLPHDMNVKYGTGYR